MPSERETQAVGRSLADALDRMPSDDLARAREMFLRGVEARRTQPSRPVKRVEPTVRTRVATAVFAIAAAAAVVLAYRGTREHGDPSVLSFTVGATAQPGKVGSWIAAGANADLPVNFSDGTVMSLTTTSHARVLDVHEDGADVAIERGRAELAVVHREKTHWTVNVGPYEVLVTGTRFAVGWTPETGTFRLAMREGSVVVSGCHVDHVVLKAGDTFEQQCPEAMVAPTIVDAGMPVPVSAASAAPEPPATPQPSVIPHIDDHATSLQADASVSEHVDAPDASVAPAEDPVASARGKWALGDYSAAWRFIEKDFDRSCANASREDLTMLADIARLTTHGEQASSALSLLRTRFPGTEPASRAAFYLGLSALDRHDARRAAQWFELVEKESPRGPLVREATGRRLEALAQYASPDEARAEALRYLATYPDGPHTSLARRLANDHASPQ
jgi:hypothetical protein